MKKLPIETVLDIREAFAPILREQARALLTAAALQGLLANPLSRPTDASIPGAAAFIADKTLREMGGLVE